MKNLIRAGLAVSLLSLSFGASATLIGTSIGCSANVPSQALDDCTPTAAIVDSNGPARGGLRAASEFTFDIAGAGSLFFDFDHIGGIDTLDIIFENPEVASFSGTFQFSIAGLMGATEANQHSGVTSFSVANEILTVVYTGAGLREENDPDLIDLQISSGQPPGPGQPPNHATEPTTLALAGLGLLALGFARRRG